MAIYKDKKRNTWFFRVYANINGTRKQVNKYGFKTKQKAKLAEDEFLLSLETDNTKNITFKELYDIFLRNKKMKLKPQSIRSLTSRFNNHILPFFKDYHIYNITNVDYIKWQEYILSNNFSYKYNANLHGCMVSILNYAMDNYDLPKNIAIKCGNFSKCNYLPNVDFWTIEEFKQFISFVDDNVYYCLYNVLFYTGMRLGECLALTWADFKDGLISIKKTLAKGKNNNQYIITTPKTKSSIRLIKLDNNTINLLNNLKNYYKTFINFSDNWFIFGGAFALSQTTIGRRKNEYCNMAHVKQIRIHDFRHSHATFLLSNGVPITVISKRLGHTDIATTMSIYSHFIPSDEDKAIIIINKLNTN